MQVFVKLRAMEKHNRFCVSMFSAKLAIVMSIIIALVLIVARTIYVVLRSGKPLPKRSPGQSLNTLIVLGSGGHTAEMINLLSLLPKDRFSPRYYVAAATDNMSLQKARVLEDALIHSDEVMGVPAEFLQIYRSREVGQSYVTSVWTTLIAMAHALWLMIKIRPQVVLCNGPGTCVPLCVIAFLFKVMGIRWSSVFYIESIARVRKLSLSGLLLYELRVADQFFVQWPQLQQKYHRAHYVGCLM